MDASDREFKKQQLTAHTVQDAEREISKLTTSLMRIVTFEITERNSPSFTDPTDAGQKKIATSWVADTLVSTSIIDLQ